MLNPKLTELYTLNNYSFLHVNYNSKKWFWKKEHQAWDKVDSPPPHPMSIELISRIQDGGGFFSFWFVLFF